MTTNPELRVEGKGQERGELTFNTQLSHNCGKATFNFISYQCYNHFYYLSLHEYTSLRRKPHVNSLYLSSFLIQCVISSKLLFISLGSWHIKEYFGICYAKIVWLIFEILKIKTLESILAVFFKNGAWIVLPRSYSFINCTITILYCLTHLLIAYNIVQYAYIVYMRE